MGNGMNKVLPGLYVGNYRDSKDHQQLDKYQITHIIAIHDSPRRLLPDKHYLCVMAADTPDQNLSQYFSVCNDFIHAARLREGNVLIHCLAGMSRSVTVAVAYIMSATNLNWKEALKVVRAGRAVANPNVGFQTQLQEFEMYRLSEERRRLKERFPSTALDMGDRSKCASALDNYQELLMNRDICEGNCTRGEKCPTGVCNMDPTKGLFRRRPSTASTRSRQRPQAAASAACGSLAASSAQSCPTSPKHLMGSRRSLGEQHIPEDEEAHLSPTTSSEAAAYAAAVTAAANQQRLQLQQQQKKPQQQEQSAQQEQEPPHKSPTIKMFASASTQSKSPRVSNAGNRLPAAATSVSTAIESAAVSAGVMGGVKKTFSSSMACADKGKTTIAADKISPKNSADKRSTPTPTTTSSGNTNNNSGDDCSSSLQRSASTISGIGVRPRSSPAGLHSYTGSVPSSVHGSRVDLSNTDKGSAIYLGCSAPRNSNWSLASSRGSSGGSAPPTPANTPPVSPRHGVRRSASMIKNKQR